MAYNPFDELDEEPKSKNPFDEIDEVPVPSSYTSPVATKPTTIIPSPSAGERPINPFDEVDVKTVSRSTGNPFDEPESGPGFIDKAKAGFAKGVRANMPPPFSSIMEAGEKSRSTASEGVWATEKGKPLPEKDKRTSGQIKRSLAEAGLEEEQGADPHPFEDPVRLALLFGIPGMAGKGFLAKASSGVGFNVGFEALDKIITEGRLPTKEELAWAVPGGLLPAGADLAFKGVAKGLRGVFKTGVEQIAKETGEPVEQVIKQVSKAAQSEGRTINSIISEKMAGLPKGAEEFNALWEKNVRESLETPGLAEEEFIMGGRKLLRDKSLTQPQIRKLVPEKYAGSINLNRQKLSLEGRELLQEAGETVGKTVRTNKEMLKEAGKLDMTPNDFLHYENPMAMTDAQKNILRQTVGDETERLATLNKDPNIPKGSLDEQKLQYIRLVAKDAYVASETGRTLQQRSLDIMPNEPIKEARIKAFEKLAQSNKAEDREFMLKHIDLLLDAKDANSVQEIMYKALTSKARKVTDALESAIINGFLSSPTTWVKVHVSQGLYTLERPFTRLPAAGIDAFLSLIRGTERTRHVQDALIDLKGMRDALPEAAEYFVKSAKAQRQVFTEDILGKPWLRRASFGEGPVGKTLGKIIQFPGGTAIGAGDDAVKVLNYRGIIHVEAHRMARKLGLRGEAYANKVADLIAHPTSDMTAKAANEAFERAMQRPLSQIGYAVQNLRDKLPIGGRIINPFITVADSTIRSAYERSPFYVISMIKNAKNLTQGEVADQVSKMLVGTIVAGGAYELAAKDMITGGVPTNKKERERWYATGRKPYSILWGNKVLPYGSLEPASTIIGTIADYHSLGQYADQSDGAWKIAALNGMQAFTRNVFNKSYMDGLANFFDMVRDPERASGSIQKQVAGALVPQISYRTATTIDPTLRDAQTMEQAFQKRIPGETFKVPPIRDLWGRPVMDIGNPISKMINPFRMSELDNDPATQAVFDLHANIISPSDSIGKIPMTLDEYELLLERKGEISHKRVAQYVQSERFAQASDRQRKIDIEKIDRKVNDAARKWIEKKVKERAKGLGYSGKEFKLIRKGAADLPEDLRK